MFDVLCFGLKLLFPIEESPNDLGSNSISGDIIHVHES